MSGSAVDRSETVDCVNMTIKTMKAIVASGNSYTTEDERIALDLAVNRLKMVCDECGGLLDDYDPPTETKTATDVGTDDMVVYSVLEYLRDCVDDDRINTTLMNSAHLSIQNATAAGWSRSG